MSCQCRQLSRWVCGWMGGWLAVRLHPCSCALCLTCTMQWPAKPLRTICSTRASPSLSSGSSRAAHSACASLYSPRMASAGRQQG
jgi:hypothetical protein